MRVRGADGCEEHKGQQKKRGGDVHCGAVLVLVGMDRSAWQKEKGTESTDVENKWKL